MLDKRSELFFKYLKFEKRYSDNTIRAYIDDIKQFFVFTQQFNPSEDYLENADYKLIRNWIVELTNQKISARSINRKLSSLKKFFKHLISSGQAQNNPFDKIIAPKVHKKLPSFLNFDETELLSQDSLYQDNITGKRDRAIIELLYCTGIRLSELINLKTNDIDFNQKTIKVIGKRNKERIIPIPEYLIPIIKVYDEEKMKLGLSAEYLLTTDKGNKSYPRMIQRIVYRYLSIISTNEKKNPHMLRHTYATHLLNNGAEINAIKELLGHANLSATQVYTHNTFQKLNKIYKQAHPRA
jgi:integrase/recombinase XerC